KVRVVLTRHAVERLLERKPREYRKVSGETIANIIENVIRSGKCLERGDGDAGRAEGLSAAGEPANVRFSTKNYTVCCRRAGDKLIVTTVINTEEMSDAYKRALRYAEESPFDDVIVMNPPRQIEKWVRAYQRKSAERRNTD
ncbi:MAG: hypothetical protein ACXQTZ_04015, partial [Candidatus Alkanophagales archaeon]